MNENNINKLKSCPFCGDNDLRVAKNVTITPAFDLHIENTNVQCLNCGASGPPIAYVIDVIEGWNNRIKV